VKIISPILKRVVYPSLAKSGFFRHSSASGLAVVTYHGVLPEGYEPLDPRLDGNLVSRDTLRQQLRLLKANYKVISPEDLLAWCEGRGELPPRAVLLTCDDGLVNHLTDMLPVLREEGLKCLFFVTGASARQEASMLWYEDLYLTLLHAPVGRFRLSEAGIEIDGELSGSEQRSAIWWSAVRRLSQTDEQARQSFLRTARGYFGLKPAAETINADAPLSRRFHLLNISELKELALAGMTIGAHTMNHPVLALSPADLVRAEINESRAHLEAALGQGVWALAYPFGDRESVTPEVFEMAKEAGYKVAFVNFGGGLGTEMPRYAMPRVHVTSEMSLAEFEACVAGFYASLQRRAGRGIPVGLRMARG
jgi:peptidoglycan/xylan/chitin deacetylase (PgdA/CDA1 family)